MSGNQYTEDHDSLFKLLRPLVRKATKMEVLSVPVPPQNSQLISHFGGQPYFESPDVWPTSANGENLDFIFQVFNGPGLELPEAVKVVQFYYDWEAYPWTSVESGWCIKIYENITPENMISVEKPAPSKKINYCEIKFKPVYSLPDWAGIGLYCNEAIKISEARAKIHDQPPRTIYQNAVERLTGKQPYQSQLGGYPKWFQRQCTPVNTGGTPLNLLFQLNTEAATGLEWGDRGLIYAFYDEKTKNKEFVLQSY